MAQSIELSLRLNNATDPPKYDVAVKNDDATLPTTNAAHPCLTGDDLEVSFPSHLSFFIIKLTDRRRNIL